MAALGAGRKSRAVCVCQVGMCRSAREPILPGIKEATLTWQSHHSARRGNAGPLLTQMRFFMARVGDSG